MEMIYKEITSEDINEVFEVRLSTDENHFTEEQLKKYGITRESISNKIQTSGKGWLCLLNKKVIGFVIADAKTAEIWIIAVLPQFVNKGIGSRLLAIAENWLGKLKCEKIWLVTDYNRKLRAYSFYLKHGWEEWKTVGEALYMQKKLK